MTTRQPQPAWWIVFFGLVVTLSVNWVLPAFDHHAVEYSPFHNHMVLNAANASERNQALAAHTHGGSQPHSHTHAAPAAQPMPWAGTAAEHTPTVIGTSLLNDLLALAASVVHVILAGDLLLPQPTQALWLIFLPAALLLLRRLTPPPEKPPRFA